MNDAILLSLSTKEFESVVKEALAALRDFSWSDLAASKLAHCSLVEQCFLEGEEHTDRLRGRLLRAVLHWAIDQLRPDGEQQWDDTDWRHYNFLSAHFLERVTLRPLARLMGITDEHLRKGVQRGALTALAALLRSALTNRQGLNGRARYASAARWDGLDAQERGLLGLAALARQPIPEEFFERAGEASTLAALLARGLLRRPADGETLEIHPALRDAVRERLTPEERRAGHERLAAYYETRFDFLEAAHHYRGMGREGIARAADLLLTHQESIRSQDRLPDLATALAAFKPFELSESQWHRLKLLAGDIALATKNVAQAIKEYKEALDATDIATRISANHRLAEAYARRDLKRAASYYDHCIRLLEESQVDPALLAQIYIDRAWLSIQELKNLAEAEDYLNRVQPNGDCRIEALWHNAWAGLLARRPNPDPHEVIKRRLQALRAADESQQRDLQLKMAKNLAFDYAELLGDYDSALRRWQQALSLAREMGERQLEGICLKDVGNGYFWRKEYQTAIRYYQEAYALLAKLGNKNWLVAVCFDLTEAYAELGETEQAQRYFDEGVALAQKLSHEGYKKRADSLRGSYPFLAKELTPRQQLILAYVKEHGWITTQQCQKLDPPVSKATALRELRKLCERGLLVQVGAGPSTRYRLPPDPSALASAP